MFWRQGRHDFFCIYIDSNLKQDFDQWYWEYGANRKERHEK